MNRHNTEFEGTAPMWMAETGGYNPQKHGTFDLMPCTDDLDDFGSEDYSKGNTTSYLASPQPSAAHESFSGFGNDKGFGFGQQSGGVQFAYVFAGNDKHMSGVPGGGDASSVIRQAGQHFRFDGTVGAQPTPTPRARPAKLLKKHVLPDEAASGQNNEAMTSFLARLKRKASEHDINPSNGKKHNYKLAPLADSLPNHDVNTNTHAQARGRRPKQYTWGTSYLRRGYRNATSTVTSTITSFFGASKPTTAGCQSANELSFDDEHTFVISQYASRDVDMDGA